MNDEIRELIRLAAQGQFIVATSDPLWRPKELERLKALIAARRLAATIEILRAEGAAVCAAR
jgi:hypothetical protein